MMKRAVGFLLVLGIAGVPLTTLAEDITLNITPEGGVSLEDAIDMVWDQPGDHTINMGAGYWTGYALGYRINVGHTAFESWVVGDRAARSLTIRGAGRSGAGATSIIAYGQSGVDKSRGWLRVHATDMNNVVFEDMQISIFDGGGVLDKLMMYHVTTTGILFQRVDVVLGWSEATQAPFLVGQVHNGKDSDNARTVKFDNSNVYLDGPWEGLETLAWRGPRNFVGTWSWAAAPVPDPGYVDGMNTSRIWRYDRDKYGEPQFFNKDYWKTERYIWDPTYGDLQYPIGANDQPAGAPNPMRNDDSIYGGFVVNFRLETGPPRVPPGVIFVIW